MTEGPPQVLTQKEVEATIAAGGGSGTDTGSATGAPAATPDTTAATPAPAGPETAEGGTSWLMWIGLILLVVIVAFFLFRRSGN